MAGTSFIRALEWKKGRFFCFLGIFRKECNHAVGGGCGPVPHNFTGFPVQVVSTGCCPVENLPVAMQVVGLPGAEARILRIAHAYEQATPEVRDRLPEILKS